MNDQRLQELEEENLQLRRQLKRAHMVLGTLPENMSIDQLIDWQSARLSSKGYFWWAAKMGAGAAVLVMWILLIFAIVSLLTGSSSVNCNMG